MPKSKKRCKAMTFFGRRCVNDASRDGYCGRHYSINYEKSRREKQ